MTTVLTNPNQVQRFFDDVGLDFARINYTPLMREEMGELVKVHEYYFATENGPDGREWPELADSTVFRKGHDRILVDSKRLMNSLTRKSASADAIRDIIAVDTGTYAVFGTNVEYSRYHDNPDGRLPFRPHVGLPPQYIDRFGERVMDYAFEKLGRAA